MSRRLSLYKLATLGAFFFVNTAYGQAVDLDFELESATQSALSEEGINVESMPMPDFSAIPDVVASEEESSVPKESLSEAEIPVLTDTKKEVTPVKSSVSRLMYSLGIIVLLALSMVSFSKWWTKRSQKSSDNNKIRVLTQHYLGPKKSLAMIRVAGETILIGVTDQNISMIKTLSLIDDEVPVDTPKTFSHAMMAVASSNSAKEEPDDYSFVDIKDKVSQKIKEMRQI